MLNKKTLKMGLTSTVALALLALSNDMEVQAETTDPAKTNISTSQQESGQQNEVNRISGEDRYHNAAEISASGWKESDTAYVVQGDDPANALTSLPLAGEDKAPLLYTRKDEPTEATEHEVDRLDPKEVVIVGNEKQVSPKVESKLADQNTEVTRVEGQDKYQQSVEIAKQKFAQNPGKKHDVFITNGEVLSDAMSISTVAAQKRIPILLTKGNSLYSPIKELAPFISRFTIIGGTSSVSKNVENELKALGPKVLRIDGKNRYEVNRNILYHYGTKDKHYYVVNGEKFSDAIPTALLAANNGSGVLLVKNHHYNTLRDQLSFAAQQGVSRFTLVGGEHSLSKKTEDFLRNPKSFYKINTINEKAALSATKGQHTISSSLYSTLAQHSDVAKYAGKDIVITQKAQYNNDVYYLVTVDNKQIGWVKPEAIVDDSLSFQWPADAKHISSNFGYRIHPIYRTSRLHEGIDIAGGGRILASEAGIVTRASRHATYGNLIIIDHGDGFTTRYAHLKDFKVKAGQKVSRGQHIATMGTTGLSTGVHLHFEVRENGVAKNPLNYI